MYRLNQSLLRMLPWQQRFPARLAVTQLSNPGERNMSGNKTKHGTEAVIFDMGGVVLPSPGVLFKEYEMQKNLPPGTILKVILNNRATGAWTRLENGELSEMEFGQAFTNECKDFLGRDVDMTDLMSQFGRHMSQPFPQIIDAVQCVRAEGLKTALLTNNWFNKSQTETYLPVDRSLFDVVVESCKVGIRKPDPRIYEICLKELDLPPEKTIFLDDLGGNLKAAKALGIRTIKVDNPDQAVKDLEAELGFSVRGYQEGTVVVPPRLELPGKKLKSYLNWVLKLQAKEEPVVRSFSHGQSNPTYFVRYAGKDMVLRKKPPGKLLPSAHAVEREFRVMKSVASQGVPVPKMLGLCEDTNLLGTPFYMMEHLKGRIFMDHLLTDSRPEERRLIYSEMIDTLCKVHSIDISAAKLDDFGKAGNYMNRNFTRWARQYEASKTGEIENMNKLLEWFPAHMPENERVTLVHGDFRLDNLVYHQTRPDVVGVLDWELSTLGDPITDLATMCICYYIPHGHPMFPVFQGLDLKSMGIPMIEEVLSQYCKRMNIPPIDNWEFYIAYNFFRFAAISQGVYKRAISGQSSSPDAVLFGEFTKQCAETAWQIASSSNLKPTNRGAGSGAAPSSGQTTGRREFSTLSRKSSEVTMTTHSMSTDAATASNLPVSVDALSPRAQSYYRQVKAFIDENLPALEKKFVTHTESEDRWNVFQPIEEMKAKAKAAGLWNLFLPKESDPGQKYGAGFSNLEYAFMCEEMGKYFCAPEVFNCSAPDTGNMEVLVKYGTQEQKQKWLIPLLNGEMRSCFGMTEPAVASSDATNIQSSIVREGNEYVINGTKWWTSGAMDPRCKICIFMGKTNPSASVHSQQSMILVPMDAPGVTILRPLSVYGYQDPPAGHAEVLFENVRVPVSNILLGEGRGFEIAQGRLGPGRIHHCMRLIGHAERALSLMADRTLDRVAFGKPLAQQGTIQADIAQSRIEIEQTRLLVLKAAHMMDCYGNKVAANEIAMIKVATPNMTLRVVDRAMQAFGGAGFHSDLPLAAFAAWARVLRMADGPDEVHRRAVARNEYKKVMKAKL